MDYEQKYKDVIKMAREAYYSPETPYVAKAWLLTMFPEIAENEDETIRKVLLDFFQAYKDKEEYGITTFNGIPTDDILTWLEKQGNMLEPDRVIKWLNDQACQGWIEDVEVDKFVEKFKKDFGL